MTVVHFSTIHKKWAFQRQTPGERMQWAEARYVFNDHNSQSDVLVVYDEPHQSFTTTIPKHRRIVFVSEPPSIKTYNLDYLNQFGTVVTAYEIQGLAKDTRQHISQLAFPWHYGVVYPDVAQNYQVYDRLAAMEPPVKTQEISTIISSKTMNEQHKKRIETTAFLESKLGGRFHRLGLGFKEVDDKADGIRPYAFHLVCENNNVPHFWTEKLADAYLGYAFPVFSGCANIGDYFPKDSYVQVDLTKPEETLDVIESLLNDADFYQSRLSAIKAARDKVLNDYNLFNVITDLAIKLDEPKTLNVAERIKPQTRPKPLVKRVYNKAISILQKFK